MLLTVQHDDYRAKDSRLRCFRYTPGLPGKTHRQMTV